MGKLTKAQVANLEHVRDHGRAKPRSPSGYWCRTHGLCEWVWNSDDQLSPDAIIIGERLTPEGRAALAQESKE